MTDRLAEMAAMLRNRGNAMRCHAVANSTIRHTEEAGELLCEIAALVESMASDQDRLRSELALVTADRDSWRDQAAARVQDALDLVAAERERCAKVCEQTDEDGEGPDCWGWHAKDYARAIRAGA